MPVKLDDPVSDRAAVQLLDMLNQNRGTLNPRTVDVVTRNLATIDRAIEEARTALAADPGNESLRAILARLYADTGRVHDAVSNVQK